MLRQKSRGDTKDHQERRRRDYTRVINLHSEIVNENRYCARTIETRRRFPINR
jgi:hypothetical protein